MDTAYCYRVNLKPGMEPTEAQKSHPTIHKYSRTNGITTCGRTVPGEDKRWKTNKYGKAEDVNCIRCQDRMAKAGLVTAEVATAWVIDRAESEKSSQPKRVKKAKAPKTRKNVEPEGDLPPAPASSAWVEGLEPVEIAPGEFQPPLSQEDKYLWQAGDLTVEDEPVEEED